MITCLSILSLSLSLPLIPATASVKAGAKCTKVGITSVASSKTYTCIKSGKKLVWNKGVRTSTSKSGSTSKSEVVIDVSKTYSTDTGYYDDIYGPQSTDPKLSSEWLEVQKSFGEIQPGFGRTGKLFGFENYDCIPDVLVIGKGMGGGMPVGAFVASEAHMDLLYDNPKLGHITTFGGHPVIAAACLATLQEITETNLMAETLEKEILFRKLLVHPLITEVRGKGLMLAAMTKNSNITNEVILRCHKRGLILFWLLFEGTAIRITPPLTISNEEIEEGCQLLLEVMDEVHALEL